MTALQFHAFLRFLSRKKGYFATHIGGITIGLVAAGFTALFVIHELSYDRQHPFATNIYRISYENKSGWFASLAAPYAHAVAEETIPEIESTVRLRRVPPKFMNVGDEKFYDSKVLFTYPGSKFFDFFQFPLDEGSVQHALTQSHSVILSASTAKKYFGEKPALGEPIRFDSLNLTVTGVFQDLPSHTHLEFDILITHAGTMDNASGHFTYAMVSPAANLVDVEEKVLKLPVNVNAFQSAKAVRLINVQDLHFDGTMTYELKPAGSLSNLLILVAVGLTILLISLTNYLNLSVALYANRSREIAVRKSVGASSRALSTQFFVESAMSVLCAMAMAVVLIYLLLPGFNDLMQVRIVSPLASGLFVVVMTGLIALIAALSALYPVFILPKIRILDLFRSAGITSYQGLKLRQALLGVQFVVLFFVCCSLWVIRDQFEFMENKDLGFQREGVIKIRRAWNVDSADYQQLKLELKKNPVVVAVSQGYAPGDEDYGFPFHGENSEEKFDNLLSHRGDFEYLEVLGIKSVLGLSPKGSDAANKMILVNETLVKQLGYTDPIGRTFTVTTDPKKPRNYIINGVVADYNFKSLHESVGPQMLVLTRNSKYVEENILVKVNTTNIKETLAFIQSTFTAIAPDVPAPITFLDDDIQRLYAKELRLGKAIQILMIISIILSFTGLVALCSYMIEYKLREVAVRKVMGADVSHIITLFVNVFVKVIVIAFIGGALVSYYSMWLWVQGFAYRVALSPWIYLITLACILGTTVLLAGWQSMRAARLNPASVLKEN